MFKLLKTVGRELFFNLKTLPRLAAAVSRTVKIRKMLYFQNERRYTDGNFQKKIHFVVNFNQVSIKIRNSKASLFWF